MSEESAPISYYYFNPDGCVEKGVAGDLPHWFQRQAMQFVTFRLADSLPQLKLRKLKLARETWMREHPEPWDEETRRMYHRLFTNLIEKWSDAGYGACVMRDERVANIVAQVLEYFEGQRYRLISYVVMPNHVHVLFVPCEGYTVNSIVYSWKSYMTRSINALLHRTGRLWQREYFDTMIRNGKHCGNVIAYICKNNERGGVRFLPSTL